MNAPRRIACSASWALALAFSCAAQQSAPAEKITGPVEFKIGGDVTAPLTVTAADRKQMPRTSLAVVNTHEKKSEVYQGVRLALLLDKAGLPRDEKLRGPLLTTYVVVEAADGYRVLFSLAELDSSFLDSEVIVADTLDGSPLAGDEGPYI